MQVPDTGFADIDIEKVELYKQQLPEPPSAPAPASFGFHLTMDTLAFS
jgi:hypothetical protein